MSARDLPEDYARAVELLSRTQRRFLAPPPRVNTAEWADEFRHVVKGPERGKWRNSRTPYLVEPMFAASSFSPYERVVLQFATQLGKSEVLYNALLQRIHTEPADAMMVQPTLQDAQDHSTQRFVPTVNACKEVQPLVAVQRSRDKSSSWRARSIQGGFTLFFAGANSAASIASKPLGFAVADEVDKWPHDVDKQGPPLALLEERLSNFSRRKLLIASTPTIKGISVIEAEYLLTDRRRYFVPCPHCGEAQVLVWGAKEEFGLKWLKTSTGAARPETAVYICRHCAAAIEERFKTGMLAEGRWVAEAPGASRGLRAGFWLNKLYSPLGWRSWASLVEKWDAAQQASRKGENAALKEFVNSSLAETFEETGTGADAEVLRRRAEDYPTNIVPRGGLLVVLGVDTQPDRLEVRTWAFGRGEESWLLERHVIYGDPNLEEGTPGSPWTTLTEIRRTPLQHAAGGTLLPEACAIDTGGHNTHAVYAYCRNHAREHVLAIKGASQYGRPVLDRPRVVDIDWRGKVVKRGVKLWQIGTDTAKHLLYGRMHLAQVGPGFVHVPKAFEATDEFEQMTASRLVPVVVQGKRSMRWVTPKGQREEGGDCMVYAYAAACYAGIQTFKEGTWARREKALGVTVEAPPPAVRPQRAPRPDDDQEPASPTGRGITGGVLPSGTRAQRGRVRLGEGFRRGAA